MKLIYLTNDGITIVDDDTYEWASKERWSQSGGGIQSTKSGKLLHRLIMNAPKDKLVDHRNHFKWDNRKENLRVCTNAQNQMNRSIQTTYKRRPKISKYKGVYYNGKKWMVQIMVDSKYVYLGYYPTEKVAALVYNKAAKLHFGEFALLNNIE